jgi:2-polyprenyl-3-methyl-5-hydroxy-6-metoxy-1,4-benzoquinol methylase
MYNASPETADNLRHEILRAHWNARVEREQERETTYPAKKVHTDLLWREIDRVIAQRQGLKILDAGAGTGRYSLPLTQAGHRLTHLDISPAMLDAARNQAERSGLSGIEYVEGGIDDLSRFPNAAFDLVLCLDSPLSFCADRYADALAELLRVTAGPLILCVINTLGVITEGGVNFDLEHFGRLKTTLNVYTTGQLEVNEELRQFVPTLMPSWKSFRPAELCALIESHGGTIARVSAPGTLCRFVRPELLTKLCEDRDAYQEYLDFEERFDADESVLGIGAVRAGGLLVTAWKQQAGSDNAI